MSKYSSMYGNSVDPDQKPCSAASMQIYTVGKGLPVPILRAILVC